MVATPSVLLIEIARRRGIDLEGVGMPGHFLVRDPRTPQSLIDPFDGGRRLDRDECETLYRSVAGAGASLTPEMLGTSRPRAILARMLTNLDRSFERRRDARSLAWVTRLRMEIPGLGVRDRLDLARRAADLGWLDRAADVFEELAGEPDLDGEVAKRLLRRSHRLRSSLN
jgi:regulator of sirC expression with transglutaminase-like and TPR domain